MLIRKYVLPRNANEEPTEANMVQDLFSAFGLNQEPEKPEPTPEGGEEPEKTEPSTESDQEPDAPEKAPNQPPISDKSNNAFAQMRVENKKFQKMLSDIAGVLGVQAKNPDEVMTALQGKLVEAQAKQQGIPPEVAQRLAILEQQNAEFNLLETRKNAYLGFQQVKDMFGLDDNSLNQFADSLVASGINPFEQKVDVISEYKLRNFDNLIKLAEERGAKAEAERSVRASQHGSSPSKNNGKEKSDEQDRINTVADLDRWLSKYK